jgi:hypothetical protein
MKSIAREKAENLFRYSILKNSKLYKKKHEIKVQFEFLDNTILVMKYNRKDFTKAFYVNKN